MREDPRAVFFDLGGTLFSYRELEPQVAVLLGDAASRLGVEAADRDLPRAYRAASRAAQREFARQPYYLHRDLFAAGFQGFAAAFERSPAPEDLDWFCAGLRRVLLEHFVLRSDCLDTLRTLRDRGLHVSIVSNIDDDYLDPMVERAGLSALLDAWTSSEEALSCKPDPGIFRLALDKAGCRAEQVVFVGDSREADVVGAQSLGMTAVLLEEAGFSPLGDDSRPDTQPDHVIHELRELLPLAAR